MNRRKFIATGAALLGLGMDATTAWASKQGSTKSAHQVEKISDHSGIYRDVVNVGFLQSNGRSLLIDSGEGSILDYPDFLPIESVLYTHYHRDQCSGAKRLKTRGIKVNVPAAEDEFFRNVTEFWVTSDKLIDHRYDFRPEMMVLRESVVPDGELYPGKKFIWQGYSIEVVATPGHTDGSLSYVVEADGKKLAFIGDLMCGAGQLWEFYSLQKKFPGMAGDYWGFGGAVKEVLSSLETVLSFTPSILVPSHGRVIPDPEGAVSLFKERITGVMRNYFTLSAWPLYQRQGIKVFKEDAPLEMRASMLDPLSPTSLPSWLHRSVETSSYIVANDKSIFLFDCGFPPIVEALGKMVGSGEISGVDGIWISHYHDDHLASVNDVRRKYGSKVFVQRELQDILQNPRAYNLPCIFPESIHVDHSLSEREVIHWKGYKMTGFYFPGQTLHHDGLLIEHQGTKVFMTGDSFANWGIDDYCSYNRNFVGRDGATTGYVRCLKLLQELQPDVLCAAHWGAVPVSPAWVQQTLDLLIERNKLLATLIAWEDPNFGLDPNWISAYPYRQSCFPGAEITLEARIYNHSDEERVARISLVVPEGWSAASTGEIRISAHTEGKVRLTAISARNSPVSRQVLGLDTWFGDLHLGELAEGIVDFLD
jgi:glyoxylase-like metal-dependent hydrolase (beta-lactamase superfamily II)